MRIPKYLMDMAMSQHDGVVVQRSLVLIGKRQDSSSPIMNMVLSQYRKRLFVCWILIWEINQCPTHSPIKLVSKKGKL